MFILNSVGGFSPKSCGMRLWRGEEYFENSGEPEGMQDKKSAHPQALMTMFMMMNTAERTTIPAAIL